MFSRFLNPSSPLDTPNLRVDCMTIEEADEVHQLACLELRGGNHLAAYSAELPGLAASGSCPPVRPSPRGRDLYYPSRCRLGARAPTLFAELACHGGQV